MGLFGFCVSFGCSLFLLLVNGVSAEIAKPAQRKVEFGELRLYVSDCVSQIGSRLFQRLLARRMDSSPGCVTLRKSPALSCSLILPFCPLWA